MKELYISSIQFPNVPSKCSDMFWWDPLLYSGS